MLISLCFVFSLSSISFSFFAHCSLCFYLSLYFSCNFFLFCVACAFASVVFQHPLMALSITFHLFIILLTNSRFSIHTSLSIYILRLCPSSSCSSSFFNYTVFAELIECYSCTKAIFHIFKWDGKKVRKKERKSLAKSAWFTVHFDVRREKMKTSDQNEREREGESKQQKKLKRRKRIR